jgi:LmbE family N-acetylglucosaminyl deacetylase
VATLISFHAHPDDEAIATSGSMARAKKEGHRVVLVVATRGEHGEIVPGVLDDGEQLGVRRVKETYAAADIIGADRVEFLGYIDSGMMGEPTNDEPGSFWSAKLDYAADRLAAILAEEQQGGTEVVLTIYDDNGGYGHPDHIQVHRVGVRAAEVAGVERVFEATMNRTDIKAGMQEIRDSGVDFPREEEPGDDFGKPADVITHGVDVQDFVAMKRDAMRAHASQISDESFFLALPGPIFDRAFGTEWFIERGRPRTADEPMRPDLLAGLS